jgi:DNA-binding MarR family transcriptional regulator
MMPPMTPAEQLYAGIQLTRPLLRHITARVEADLAGSGVSVGQRAILEVLLAVERASAPQITEMLDVTRQFVGREIKALLEKGFVVGSVNPSHRTSRYYHLTEESRGIIEGIRAREMAAFEEVATRFTRDEIAAYYKVQSALNAGLSSKEGDTDEI